MAVAVAVEVAFALPIRGETPPIRTLWPSPGAQPVRLAFVAAQPQADYTKNEWQSEAAYRHGAAVSICCRLMPIFKVFE